MERLTPDEMLITGGGRCGGTWSSIAVEATLTAAGAFIGFGLSAGLPAGAIAGAKLGFALGGIVCHAS